jgi:hypothetical protein
MKLLWVRFKQRLCRHKFVGQWALKQCVKCGKIKVKNEPNFS